MYSCWQILLHLLFPRNDRQRIRQERHDPNSSKKKFWRNQRVLGNSSEGNPKAFKYLHLSTHLSILSVVGHNLVLWITSCDKEALIVKEVN